MFELGSTITLIAATKALGGSFHSLFTQVGIVEYHGPILGTLLCGLMAACFLGVRTKPSETTREPFSPADRYLCVALLLLISAAMFVRIRSISLTPLDVERADNLPAVLSGLSDVVQWRNPYHPHVLTPTNTIPHYYLPAAWLAYLPCYAMGIDIRWTNIAAHLLLYLLLVDIFFRRNRVERNPLNRFLFFILIATHAFSKHALRSVIDVHMGSLWIWSSLFFWSVIAEKRSVTRISIPVLLLSREMAFILVAPFLLGLWRRNRNEFWKATFVATVIGLSLTVPFLLENPMSLFLAAKFYAKTVSLTPWQHMLHHFGLCGLLKKWDLLWPRPILQWSGLVIALALAWREKDEVRTLALGGLAYLPFILFVSMTWGYLFNEPLALIFFLAATYPPRVLNANIFVPKLRRSVDEFAH